MKIHSLSLGAFLLFLLFPIAAQAQLLENPGFEFSKNGWKISEPKPTSSISEEAAHTGKFGLKLVDESAEGGANVVSERFPVTPGQKVTLSFWARSNKDTFAAVVLVPFAGSKSISDDKGRFPSVYIKRNSDEWTQYDFEYLVPDEITDLAISVRSWTASIGTADLDDFELRIE